MERTTFGLLFYIRRNKLNKSGEVPIFLRITVNGQRADASMKRTIPLRLWNSAKGKATEKGIGYIVFAQFSYPSYVPGLLVLFPILLASIHSKPLAVNIHLGIHWSMAVVLILLSGYVGMEYSFRKQCPKTIPQLFSANPSRATHARQFTETHYRHLLNYPRMADIYGQYVYAFGKTEYAIGVLNDLKRIVPTSELYCDLGDLYKSENKWKQALDCYGTAHAMVPRRLTPVYKSFKAYCEMEDTISAQQQAAKVLSIPVQVENTRTLKMKTEMKNI